VAIHNATCPSTGQTSQVPLAENQDENRRDLRDHLDLA
jgi:hypothetical protein